MSEYELSAERQEVEVDADKVLGWTDNSITSS